MYFHRLVPLTIFVFAACPSTPIDSVDGLAGGTLTSQLTAPSVAATAITTESLDATGDLTAETVSAGSVVASDGVSAKAMTADSLTISGTASAAAVIVERGAARVSFFGLIVGTTPRTIGESPADQDGLTPNYVVRQQACAEAFPATEALPAAHLCSVQEAMAHALQAPATVPPSANGAVVHAFGHAVFASPSGDGTRQEVTDCGAMDSESPSTDSSLRLQRRTEDGLWGLRIQNVCSREEPVLCCQ
jgi:hypothetical protein